MKLRIISDGTPAGTRIINTNGDRVEDVTAVSWSITADKCATVTLTLANVSVDVVGEQEKQMSLLTCPICEAQFLMDTDQAGRKADYKGTNVRWECGTCKKKSYAEDWFDTSGMN